MRNLEYPDIPITARMLLTHTSSLSWLSENQDPELSLRMKESEARPLRRWVEDYLIPDGATYHPMGWKNFEPLGMHQTGFRLGDVGWDNLVTLLHDGEPILQYSMPY